MSPAPAALSVAAAAAALLAARGLGAGITAALVGVAILAVWSVGAAGGRAADGGPPARDRPAGGAHRGRRRLWDRLTGVGLALSLGAGCLLASGLADGPGPFGLPRSLWGLLVGVWLLPLVLTSAGFAAAFTPPDPEGLKKLRPGGGRAP